MDAPVITQPPMRFIVLVVNLLHHLQQDGLLLVCAHRLRYCHHHRAKSLVVLNLQSLRFNPLPNEIVDFRQMGFVRAHPRRYACEWHLRRRGLYGRPNHIAALV